MRWWFFVNGVNMVNAVSAVKNTVGGGLWWWKRGAYFEYLSGHLEEIWGWRSWNIRG